MSRRLALLSLGAVSLLAASGAGVWARTARPLPEKAEAVHCAKAAFRVVVDVGHTMGVPGAKSARGANEYDFNLRLAKDVVDKLIAAGFGRTVLLITDVAPRAGLFKRAERANRLGADLLLSIHHDSVPDAFLEKWEYEGEEHYFSDRFRGHSIFISNENADPKGSLLFGHLLGDELKARHLQYTPHYTEAIMGHRRRELVDPEAGVYRYDQLVVLRETHMPAALLEAGSIINRDEELLVATPEYRALVAASVADAVTQFCAARAPVQRTTSTSR
jgi:N-acetylmuramoyl-L-alanine amidase